MITLCILIILIVCSSPLSAVQDTDFTMSGAVLKEKATDYEIWKKDDGTIISIYSDRSEAVFADKSKIIKYNDGRRESISADGARVYVDDANGIREYSGSTKKRISFEGRTPFGEKIDRVEKKILKDPVLIRLIYIPERSDEILYPGNTEEKFELEIQVFFDALYDALRQKYINAANENLPLPAKPFDIQVSYCRYCKTGYCFGKPRKVIVEMVEKENIVKTFEYDGLLIRNKEKMKEFIRQIKESAN